MTEFCGVVLRPLYCQLGVCTKADGSAQFSQGSSTTVLAGVFGPMEVKRSRERADRLDVEVTLLPRTGQSGVASRSHEAMIRQICEAAIRTSLHPRSGVHVSLQILEDDDDMASVVAAINASCLALADAGVAMKCLFAAVNVAIFGQEIVVLDPDNKHHKKNKKASCQLLFVFESRNKDIVATHLSGGTCTEAKYQECLGAARKASQHLFDFYRDVIKRKFSKEFM